MKKIFGIFTLVTLLTSCNLDINSDPLSPTDVDKSFVLTAAQGSLATALGGQLTNLGGFLAQYHTQAPSASQYLDIDTYNMNADFSNRLWGEIYAGCLNDLDYVIEKSDDEGDTGSKLIASLLKAYTFQVLTDLYGDIPYSEALQAPENISPIVDSGKDIYLGLISDVTSALESYNDNLGLSDVGSQDAIYGANMDDWVKFGNTLLLKLYMRVSYTDIANPTEVINLVNENNFIVEDAKFALYENAADKANPFYDVQLDHLGDVNNVASLSLLNFYDANADPRIAAVYRTNNDAIYRGVDQGDRESYPSELAQAFSRPNITALTPVYLMTVAESYFLQAEALIRYNAGAGAKEKYDTGVISSFSTYGVSGVESLIASGGAYEYVADSDIETAIKQVMIQKWASLAYTNTIEGFFESNRTQYPETVTIGNEDYASANLVVSVTSVLIGDATPNTILYPGDEVARNPNIVQKSSLTEKIWWDQK